MACKSMIQRLLLRAASDAAFRVLPPLVRLLYLELLAFAAAAPEAGRIRFLGSVSASVSRLVSMPETDVETGLQTLIMLGMIEHDAEASALLLPGARAASARAEAARINGLKGGRPRSDGSPARRRNQQTELLLPISGRAAETQETKAEPKSESSRAPAVVTTTPLKEDSSNSREQIDFVALGQQVFEAAGLDPARCTVDFQRVRMWLAQGATPEAILRGVRTAAGRKTYQANLIRTLKYFDDAVERAKAQRPAAQPADDLLRNIADDDFAQKQMAWALNPVGPRPRRAA